MCVNGVFANRIPKKEREKKKKKRKQAERERERDCHWNDWSFETYFIHP